MGEQEVQSKREAVLQRLESIGEPKQPSVETHGPSGEQSESLAASQPEALGDVGSEQSSIQEAIVQEAKDSGRTVEQVHREFSRKFGNMSEQLQLVQQRSDLLKDENASLRESLVGFQQFQQEQFLLQQQQQQQQQQVDPYAGLDELDPDYELKVLQIQHNQTLQRLEQVESMNQRKWQEQEALAMSRQEEYETERLAQQIHNSIEAVVASATSNPNFAKLPESDLSTIIGMARDLAGSKMMDLNGDLGRLDEVSEYVNSKLGFVANLTGSQRRSVATPAPRAPIRGAQQPQVSTAEMAKPRRLTEEESRRAKVAMLLGSDHSKQFFRS